MSLATTQTISRSDLRVFAFTRDKVLEDTIDHVFSHSPSLSRLFGQEPGNFGRSMRSDGKMVQTGGHAILFRNRLGSHQGAKAMAGPWDTHNTTPDDNVRMGEANWVHYSHGLVVSEYDRAVNQGAEALASFIADQTESVLFALADLVGDHLWSTSLVTPGVTNVDSLISANDAVHTLSGANYDNYNSRGLSARGTAAASISFTSGSFATQGLEDMRTAFNNSSEGEIMPTDVFCSYTDHERYEGRLQPQERFAAPAQTGDGAFMRLAFRQVPVTAEPKCTAGRMYFMRIGQDGIHSRILSPFDFRFAEFKPAQDQEAFVSELQLKLNTIIRNRRYGNNKMIGITD